MNISGMTRVCALIGDPVGHSLSPAIQNAAFQHLGLEYVYVAFDVNKNELSNAIIGVRSLRLHGLNVTMPHKTSVIRFLDELDETAKEAGSVNTILNLSGRLVGYTTDGIGALNALKYSGVDPSKKKIVILGAGGVSRAVSFALAKEAEEFVILNRTLKKADEIAVGLSRLQPRAKRIKTKSLSDDNLGIELKDADILVNATCVGMTPNENEIPFETSLLRPDMVVFDLVYEPQETRLLKEARSIGAKTVQGLAMLVHQGASSFEILTGRKAPFEVMMEAATKELRLEKEK